MFKLFGNQIDKKKGKNRHISHLVQRLNDDNCQGWAGWNPVWVLGTWLLRPHLLSLESRKLKLGSKLGLEFRHSEMGCGRPPTHLNWKGKLFSVVKVMLYQLHCVLSSSAKIWKKKSLFSEKNPVKILEDSNVQWRLKTIDLGELKWFWEDPLSKVISESQLHF